MSERDAGVGASFAGMALDRLLDAFADPGPAPAGGAAAVLSVALSASLCTMAARLSSGHDTGFGRLAEEAEALRRDLAPLCDEDVRAYLRVMAARRLTPEPDPDARLRAVAAALSDAADVPMTVVAAGARLAGLAAEIAEGGNPAVGGDALVAALLAAAGAEAAGALVRINLVDGDGEGDGRLAVAAGLVDDAVRSAARARRAVAPPPAAGRRVDEPGAVPRRPRRR